MRKDIEEYISRKVRKLRREGYSTKQSLAIAYSYVRRKKLKL